MPITCRLKSRFGTSFCTRECPADRVFRYGKVASEGDLPPADESIVDVALLDMNHGWPNMGHDSLVHHVRDAACDLLDPLAGTPLQVRVLSFEVRQAHMLPEPPGGRFALYIGTGGPGHLDPHQNDGIQAWSQGIVEDPAWEGPLFRLLDAIRDDSEAAFLAVCHSFGVLCRWSGAAEAVLRAPEKGKSTGILENILTEEGRAHPWFHRFSEHLKDGRRLRVVDNRLFDLIATGPPGGTPPALSHETLGIGGPEGTSVTMLEFARDSSGILPRILGVNHHPEIRDRSTQLMLLKEKLERGEVSSSWYAERAEILTKTYPDENSDQRLQITSDYTLLGPMRFHLFRQVRKRAELLGLRVDVHEGRIEEGGDGAAVAASLRGAAGA